jgi:hypothetical protein
MGAELEHLAAARGDGSRALGTDAPGGGGKRPIQASDGSEPGRRARYGGQDPVAFGRVKSSVDPGRRQLSWQPGDCRKLVWGPGLHDQPERVYEPVTADALFRQSERANFEHPAGRRNLSAAGPGLAWAIVIHDVAVHEQCADDAGPFSQNA